MKPKPVIISMKNICLLLLFIITGFATQAQDTVKKVVTRRLNINRNTVVKDSTGKRYPFEEWTRLMRTKAYSLREDDGRDANTAFTLIKRDTTGDGLQRKLDVERIAELPKPRESENFTIGQEIESFSTHDMNGNKIKLKELRGKVVMINFWFIGCPPCMGEIPELNKLADQYKDNPNVVFVAIALDSRYDLKKFLKTTPFNFAIIDNGRFFANIYNIHLYPTSVILNKEGKVAFHTVSFAQNSPFWMKKTIDEALK